MGLPDFGTAGFFGILALFIGLADCAVYLIPALVAILLGLIAWAIWYDRKKAREAKR